MGRLIGYLEGREVDSEADSVLVRLSTPVCCPWVCPEAHPEDTAKTPSSDFQIGDK